MRLESRPPCTPLIFFEADADGGIKTFMNAGPKYQTEMPGHQHRSADIVIAGGGLAGLSMALALSKGPLDIVLVDALEPSRQLADIFDGRVSALSFSSRRLMQAIGVWEALSSHAQPINDIVVSDGTLENGASPFFLHFDHSEIGEGPLGHLIENRHIRRVFFEAIERTSNIHLIAPENVASLTTQGETTIARLRSGLSIQARLGIVAEGRASQLRKQAGIRTIGWNYKQSGIVVTVEHEYAHDGIAHEYFLPGGPFAILPMLGRRSSLVWTEPTAKAQALLALDDESFQTELTLRIGDVHGNAYAVGPRWSYPLSLTLARSYIAERLALIGDSAHAIHPLAGQGFNLGLRDVAALAQIVVDHARLGLDIGSTVALEEYQRWRRFDSLTLAVFTDGMNRLFSNDIAPLRLLRDVGLSLVGSVGPVRRTFMRHAAGAVGELPRALKGEAI